MRKNKPLSYFTEYSEKIRVIEDRDGDGKADFGQIYPDGFNDPLDGTAAGVMALDGKIYFACIPHVWMLEDTDGDLKADKRESLQEGYGISVSLSGHDLNGFDLGPDNRIYFTIGDRGYNLKTKDGRHLYSQYEGAAFRMERDGSNLEVVHTGLRNPKEVAFDQFGNLFSVDNNADMGDEARVVDIVEGAYFGWYRGHQAFQKFTNLIYGTRRHKTQWMEERWWDMDSDLRPQAILAPSAELASGYSAIAMTMKDGSIVAGILMKQTDTEVIVQNPETKENTVCKKEDIEVLPPAMSSMPPMGLILDRFPNGIAEIVETDGARIKA